jgi:hypothetical protein
MTRHEFDRLQAMIGKMAVAADELARTLETLAKAETDARRHATLMRWHNSLRDAALGLQLALADAPKMTVQP